MSDLITVFGIDWKMLVVETINFVVLLGGLSYFLYTPAMKLLAERSAKIAKGVKDAEEAARIAKEAESKKLSIIASAEKEAEKIVDGAVKEGKDERAEIVKRAQDRGEQIARDAELQAAEAKRRALAESEKDIARMAVLAAEKILAKN